MFLIVPNSQFVLAALPLAVDDDEHAGRNIAEAQRVLRKLIESHPELFEILGKRHLVISQRADYSRDAIELRSNSVPPSKWTQRTENDDLDEELVSTF